MCVISQSENGQLTFCSAHRHYHLEFGNVILHLSKTELNDLKRYVDSIDFDYYFNKNRDTTYHRKVFLNVGSSKINFALTKAEFIDLQRLLSLDFRRKLIPNNEFIDFTLIIN